MIILTHIYYSTEITNQIVKNTNAASPQSIFLYKKKLGNGGKGISNT
jgi:hypothetical protein